MLHTQPNSHGKSLDEDEVQDIIRKLIQQGNQISKAHENAIKVKKINTSNLPDPKLISHMDNKELAYCSKGIGTLMTTEKVKWNQISAMK